MTSVPVVDRPERAYTFSALQGKSSQELNQFFDSAGLRRVYPEGARNEEERNAGIIRDQLNLADKRPESLIKICRGLGLPTPNEVVGEAAVRSAKAGGRLIKKFEMVNENRRRSNVADVGRVVPERSSRMAWCPGELSDCRCKAKSEIGV